MCSTSALGVGAVVDGADSTSLIKTRLSPPASVTAVAGLEPGVGSLADVVALPSSLLRESTAAPCSSLGARVRRPEVRLHGGAPGFLCCRIVAVRQIEGVNLIASDYCSRRRGCRCLCLATGLLCTRPARPRGTSRRSKKLVTERETPAQSTTNPIYLWGVWVLLLLFFGVWGFLCTK